MATTPQTRELARKVANLEKQILALKQPRLGYSTIDSGVLIINDENGNPVGSIGAAGVDAPNIVHLNTVAAIETDIQNAYDQIAAGDSAIQLQINDAVDAYNALYGAAVNSLDQTVSGLVNKLETKSKHTLSLNAPTANDVNNAGDVWERYKVVSAEADGTPVSPPENRVDGRWRGTGGTTGAYTWKPMDLDATFIPKLDVATGTFGDLTGDRIAVKTLGAEHLVVTDWTNYLPEVSQWHGEGATSTTGGTDATGDFVTFENTGGANKHFNPKGGALFVAVDPNSEWFFEWDVYAAYAGFAGSTNGYFAFYDRDKVTSAGSAVTVGTIAQGKDHYGATSGSFKVPSGAYWMRFYPYVAPNGKSTIRRFVLRRKSAGELFVDGSIITKHLAARVVGADKIIVSDFTNYITNPGAEDGTVSPHAPFGSATWSTVTNPLKSGKYGFRGVIPTISSAGYVLTLNGDRTSIVQKLPVVEGDVVIAECWARIGAVSGASQAGLWFDRLDANGALLANVTGAAPAPSELDPSPARARVLTTSYQRLVSQYTVPAGVSYIGLALGGIATTAGDVFHVDDFSLRLKYNGKLIVDGTILARHVSADMVNGLIVTGSAIQTENNGAPSTWTAVGGANPPKGIKMTSTGLVAYSSGVGTNAKPAGTPVTSIDANTGRISAVGGLATATGFDDIEITAGDADTPAKMTFWSDGLQQATRAAVMGFDSTPENPAGTIWDAMTVSLRGAVMSGSTTYPRIDIDSRRRRSDGTVNADLHYHAGGSGADGDGSHYFWIDGVGTVTINKTGLLVLGSDGIGIGATAANAQGVYALGEGRFSQLRAANMYPSTEQPVYVNSNGLLKLQGSTERFKTEIQPISLDMAMGFLDVEGVSYRYTEEYDEEDHVRRRRPGMLAGRLIEKGLDLWVYFDDQGRPSGIDYPAVTTAHNVLLRDLYEQVRQVRQIIEGSTPV